MRLIDADRIKSSTPNWMLEHDVLDSQPTVIEGSVAEAKLSYQKYARVKPTKIYYEQGYYKYRCPVCEALGHKHQVGIGQDNCPLCGVNLYWDEDITE